MNGKTPNFASGFSKERDVRDLGLVAGQALGPDVLLILDEIRTIQNAILYSYNKDISKHASSKDIPRIHQVWESIPQQLAKENKKFVYGAIRSGARAKEFETAIQWLADAGTIHKVSRIRKATLPLKFYEDLEAFKLFVVDCLGSHDFYTSRRNSCWREYL